MKRIAAKFRITLGLVSLLISVLLAAMALDLIPDHRAAIVKGRAELCETIAIDASLLMTQRDIRRLEALLEAVVRRNPDILSSGLRRADGNLVIDVGNHKRPWSEKKNNASLDSHVYVPIWNRDELWGNVEVRFRALHAGGFVGFLLQPSTRLLIFVGGASFLLFLLYLGKVLQHLNPAKTVPSRVRAALDTLAEGLLVLDRKDRIVLANQAFAETVGQSAEQLQGIHVSRLPWTDVAGERFSGNYPWSQAQEEKATQTGLILGLRGAREGLRRFVVNSSPILEEGGVVRGVLSSFEDVTELEENKLELRKSAKAAEAANRAKTAFLATMSHEIRTPMNAILGFTDSLRRGLVKGEAERAECLSVIHSSGRHLLDLINDILDLSRIESGRLEIESLRFSPHEIISEVVTVLRVPAREKNIELDYRIDGGIPETIVSDPARFRQILINLVGNAVKFTEKGGVELAARMVGKDKQVQLAVDVIDTGIGMDPDTVARIFEPFVQADSSVTRRFGGTGLGLAISRRFALALCGDVEVRSELGKGSVFTVRIDAGAIEGVRMIKPRCETRGPSVEESSEPAAIDLPPGKVLVVEDGETNRDLLTLILEHTGVEVDTAENGQVAVELATSKEFDAILMDMEMPVLDGYGATRELRKRGIEIPIIALTAHAMQGDEEKCTAAGCSGFLTKPIDTDLLVKILGEKLGQRRE